MDLPAILNGLSLQQALHCGDLNLRFLRNLPGERPDTAIVVTREADPDARWDCSKPNDEDFEAFMYTVTATCVRGGIQYEGTAHLGNCWEHEFDGYMNGYLPQKVREALEHLDTTLKGKPS